jgi:uroporphyrinogen decarboxylase
MTGYERINAAFTGEKPDQVPVILHNFMMAARECGITMEQFRNSPRIMADCYIRSVEKYQLDAVLVDLDTVTLAGAAGVPVDFPVYEPARSHQGCLENLEDCRSLKPVQIENYKYIQVWLESVRILKEYFRNDVFVRGNCDQAPFSLASMIRGSQNWMLDLMVADEDLIYRLLEYCTGITSQFIRLMAQTGADMVSNGDSVSGPDMISPEMYEKFALPFEKRIVEIAHSLGKPYALHICGNTDSILDKMMLTGADALELDYKTDAVKARDVMQDKVTFIGNIDPSGILALGSPEDVRIKTVELLGIFAGTKRFILNSGCALPSTTPAENIRMMIDVARNQIPAQMF